MSEITTETTPLINNNSDEKYTKLLSKMEENLLIFPKVLSYFDSYYRKHLKPEVLSLEDLESAINRGDYFKDHVNLGGACIRLIHALSFVPIVVDLYVLFGLDTDSKNSDGKETNPFTMWDKYYKRKGDTNAEREPWLILGIEKAVDMIQFSFKLGVDLFEDFEASLLMSPLIFLISAFYSVGIFILIASFYAMLSPFIAIAMIGQSLFILTTLPRIVYAIPDLVVGVIKAFVPTLGTIALIALIGLLVIETVITAALVLPVYTGLRTFLFLKNSVLPALANVLGEIMSGIKQTIKELQNLIKSASVVAPTPALEQKKLAFAEKTDAEIKPVEMQQVASDASRVGEQPRPAFPFLPSLRSLFSSTPA